MKEIKIKKKKSLIKKILIFFLLLYNGNGLLIGSSAGTYALLFFMFFLLGANFSELVGPNKTIIGTLARPIICITPLSIDTAKSNLFAKQR